MPTRSRQAWSERASRILIVSQSGRALAHSARRAGWLPSVADLFADLDTSSVSEHCIAVAGSEHGFDCGQLAEALAILDPRQSMGLIYGSGFEAAPWELQMLCAKRLLLGNSPHVVASVKNPWHLSSLCAALDIPHPEVRNQSAPGDAQWLLKRIGGSGGGHVQHWSAQSAVPEGDYYLQRRVPGRTVGVTFLADGARSQVLGVAQQWHDASEVGRPFRYAGAVALSSSQLGAPLLSQLDAALLSLVAATGMRGLCSADLVVNSEQWWLIEVNPRPGATFELHERDASLLAWHCQALQGRLPRGWARSGGTRRAHRIVFAPWCIRVPEVANWPDWVSDRPRPGTLLCAGEPVCMLHAEGPTSASAHALLRRRRRILTETLEQWQST